MRKQKSLITLGLLIFAVPIEVLRAIDGNPALAQTIVEKIKKQ